MAHELENERSMIYVGETPWHRLGVKLDAPPTTREAMVAAGMDWEVGLKPLFTANGEQVDHRAAYRISDGKIFGVVGPSWKPLQNREAFEWFDPFLDAKEATIETAGSLFAGARVWVLAKLSRDPMVIVPGDEVQKYILLANSHDGSIATRVGFTPVRVVCHNTLSMAVDGGVSKLLRVRHTKNVLDALNAVRDVMNTANASFEATAEQYRFLASKGVHENDLEKYVETVFQRKALPQKATAPKALPTATGTKNNPIMGELIDEEEDSRTLKMIKELFEAGVGNALPGVKGTWWAAYNAVTEFTTHKRGRSDETRLAAQFNDGARINQRAFATALAMAA